MNKPEYANNMNYTTDNPMPVSNSIKIPKGAYISQILKVEDLPKISCLKIWFDIVRGDYSRAFARKANNNLDEWDYKGTILVSYENQSQFQAFITSIMKSNQNFVWDWNEQNLKGKYAVVVFGETEFMGVDGTIGISIKPRFFRSIEALQKNEIELPPLKKLKQEHNNTAEPFGKFGKPTFGLQKEEQQEPSFNNGVEIDDDDLPF